jgi:hypothetical protein
MSVPAFAMGDLLLVPPEPPVSPVLPELTCCTGSFLQPVFSANIIKQNKSGITFIFFITLVYNYDIKLFQVIMIFLIMRPSIMQVRLNSVLARQKILA